MEDSSFPLAVNGSVYSSGLPNGTDATTYYCADASGALAGVSIGAPCAPLAPFKMTCQLGGTIADASETPFLYFAAGVPLEQIPVQNYEATVLAGLGFDSVAAFTDFVKSHASASYLKDNPDYNPCFVAGDKIIIAIFAIMMMGEVNGMMDSQNESGPSGLEMTYCAITKEKMMGMVMGSMNCCESASLSTAEPTAAKRAL
jgi:hypothetical protein